MVERSKLPDSAGQTTILRHIGTVPLFIIIVVIKALYRTKVACQSQRPPQPTQQNTLLSRRTVAFNTKHSIFSVTLPTASAAPIFSVASL